MDQMKDDMEADAYKESNNLKPNDILGLGKKSTSFVKTPFVDRSSSGAT